MDAVGYEEDALVGGVGVWEGLASCWVYHGYSVVVRISVFAAVDSGESHQCLLGKEHPTMDVADM